MKIAFVSAEVRPLAKTGGLADYTHSLATALSSAGHEVDVITPDYAPLPGAELGTEEATVDINGRVLAFRRREADGLQAVVTGNTELFGRPDMYGYEDDASRFAYFSKAVVRYIAERGYDVVHCNDWQTGYVPLLLREMGVPTPSVYTIHNLEFQGNSSPALLDDIGIGRQYFNMDGVEFYGNASAMKAGIVYSDALVTVSPTYSREIQTPEFGFGMDGIIRHHSGKLVGILNGIDYRTWNPSGDSELNTGFDADSPQGKVQCRSRLQREFALPQVRRPILSFIGRLWRQKGMDMLIEALPYVKGSYQLIILGTGDRELMRRIEALCAAHPSYRGIMRFDEPLAHRIYAGSDIFIMPSRFEPCGLGQMISMRYGTVPVVRRTGGLADTVRSYDPDTEGGEGFVFADSDPMELAGAISDAIRTFSNKARWAKLVSNCMKNDFSWEKSAGKYEELYGSLVSGGVRAS